MDVFEKIHCLFFGDIWLEVNSLAHPAVSISTKNPFHKMEVDITDLATMILRRKIEQFMEVTDISEPPDYDELKLLLLNYSIFLFGNIIPEVKMEMDQQSSAKESDG